VEPWDKVLIRTNTRIGINSYVDVDPQHAQIGCAGCHQGTSPVDAADDTTAFRKAHAGMIVDPSAEAEYSCAGSSCHGGIVRSNATSMHTQLWGYKATIAKRFGETDFEDCPANVKEGFTKDCTSCHTTCGQCHVSVPNTAGGGFMVQNVGFSHKFIRTPDEANVCTACHGSRIGDDWNGHIEGNQPDTHNEYGYGCLDCHHEDLHGDGPGDAEYTNRYEVAGLPQCVDCHQSTADDNVYHVQHWPNGDETDGSDLACYVCHSQQYNNCNTCHAGTWQDEYNEQNTDEYRVYHQFKVGKNPSYADEDHVHGDAEWIAVRHIPVSTDAFVNEPWGIPDMRTYSYDELPTWKYSSPHNIQLWTDRTQIAMTADDSAKWVRDDLGYELIDTVGYCYIRCHTKLGGAHGEINEDLFLREDDFVADFTGDDLQDEAAANADVMIDGFACTACHKN